MKEFFNRSIYHRIVLFLLTAGIYFCIGSESLQLATLNPNASPIWFCSGFAIGMLVLFGAWLAPAIFLGALATNMLVDTPSMALAFIAYGNMLEAYVGSRLVSWYLMRAPLKAYSELFAILTCAFVAPILSAIIGANSIHLFTERGTTDLYYSMFTWWSGDAIGIMVILPLFTELYSSGIKRSLPSVARLISGLTLIYLIFWLNWQVHFAGLNQAFAWILGPLLLALGFVLGPLVARLSLVILSLASVYYTWLGFSLFEVGNLNLNLIFSQFLLFGFALAVLFYRPYSVRLRHSSKFLFGNFIGWTCIFIGIYLVSDIEKTRLRSDFETKVAETVESLREREVQIEILLEGGKAFVRLYPKTTGNVWKNYVASLKTGGMLNSVQGMGLVYHFKKTEKTPVTVKVIDEEFSRQFDDRIVVTAIEPLTLNYRALGLDIGSDEQLRRAAMEAIALKKSIASGPLTLELTESKLPGFLVLHPIYGMKREFIGWSCIPIIYERYFRQAMKPVESQVQLSVRANGKVYFSNSRSSRTSLNPQFKVQRRISIFGVPHELEFYPSVQFLDRYKGATPFIAILLSLFLYFLSSFLLELMTFTQRSEELVDKKTRELDASRMKLIYNSKMASLGEMASGMAHEINNPLSAILVKTEVLKVMLKEKGIDGGDISAEVEKIKSILGRIGKIVSGLRTFSRTSADDPFEPAQLQEVVNETLDLCSEKLKSKGIVLKVQKCPNVILICKPGQISQVLLNLLNNAADAVEGQLEKRIDITFQEFGSRVQIRVTDSGPGIPDYVAARMMEPFYTTKEPNRGTGLGLSISKGIVEDHQGRLWFEQNHAQTRFIVELPTMSPKDLSDA